MKTKTIIIFLVIAVLVLSSIIGYTEFIKYRDRVYQIGMSDGQTILAMEQFDRGIVVFSNGTAVQTRSIEDLCESSQTNEGGK